MLNPTARLADIFERCKSCFMCRHVCSSARSLNTESDSPRGRALILSMVRRRTLEYSPRIAEAVYSCTLCAHCRASCVSRYDFPAVVLAARAELAEAGLLPPALAEMRDGLAASDNPYGSGGPGGDLKAAINSLPATAHDFLLLGPAARFRRPSAGLAAIRALKKLGLSFTAALEEPSSVFLLRELGAVREADEKLELLAGKIRAAKAERIICLDPRAYYWLGRAEERPLELPAVHFLEPVAQNAGQLKAVLGQTPFSYHETDYLARWADLAGPTAAVLAALGSAWREPYWKGAEARSLGGPLIEKNFPGLARTLAGARLKDFTEQGVRIVLGASADDLALMDGQAPAGLEFQHLAEVVDRGFS